MIQAQTDRFNTLQKRRTKVGSKPGPGESAPLSVLDAHKRLFSSQRERRLDRSKTRDTERRPSRVSSLRRKPSDPKTGSSVDGSDRSPTAERKPSRTLSGGSGSSRRPSRPEPPPRGSLSFKGTPEEVQRPRRRPQKNPGPVRTPPDPPTLSPPPSAQEAPEEVRRPRHSDPWTPKARPELCPSSPSLDPPPPASPNPPPPPPPSPPGSDTREELRPPKSKPPLPPKPRIPTEQRSRLGPVEPTKTPGPASSPLPSSEASGPKPAAQGARGEEPASADLPRPIRSQDRLEGSLEIKLKQGGNKVTAEETPPGAGSGPPGQQGATRTGRVRADGSVSAGPGALGGGLCCAGGRRPQPVQRPSGGRTGASRTPADPPGGSGKPGSTCGLLCLHRGPPGGPPSRPGGPSVRRTVTTGGRRTPSD